MNLLLKDAIWKAGFKPVEEYNDFDNKLRAKLGLSNKYESARLALGRSLSESTPPHALSSNTKYGKAIAGEHLFGMDIDLWICAIILDGELGVNASVDDLRNMVESHWARGLSLLRDDYERCEGDEAKLISNIADLLPDSKNVDYEDFSTFDTGEVRIKVGELSKIYQSDEEVHIVLNGQGTSPHIALMGKVGSGKTTTGIQIVRQIIEKTNIPVLIIDPKGEFVDGKNLSGRIKEYGLNIEPIEVGIQPIPLDFLPDRSIGNVSIQNASMQFRDSIVLCCKGAGNIQQDLLRTAIENVIRNAKQKDLNSIKEYYKSELEFNEKKHDIIMSRLNELTALRTFEPDMSVAEFFKKSWVLSLKALGTEELKRLTILLVLDALKTFVLSQNDSPVVNGYRYLRHLLLIDEARRILAEKKYQSLVDIVRQSRSKGSVVILLSQDPSDFEGQADDFTTQLGSCIAFACSQTQHGLKALQGVYGRKVMSNEFTDTWLPKGVAFAKLPGRIPERIVCWE